MEMNQTKCFFYTMFVLVVATISLAEAIENPLAGTIETNEKKQMGTMDRIDEWFSQHEARPTREMFDMKDDCNTCGNDCDPQKCGCPPGQCVDLDGICSHCPS